MSQFISFDFYAATDDFADYDTSGNNVVEWPAYNFNTSSADVAVESGDLLVIVAQFHVPSGATPVVEFGSGTTSKPYTFTADTSWDSHVLTEFVTGDVWTKVWARRIGDTAVPVAGGTLITNVTGLPLVDNGAGFIVNRPDAGHVYSTVLRDIGDVSLVYHQAFGPATPYTPPSFPDNGVHYLFGHTSDTAGTGSFEPRALPNGEEGTTVGTIGPGRATPQASFAWENNNATEWLGVAQWSTVGRSAAFTGWEWSQTASVTGVILAIAGPLVPRMMMVL